MANKVLDADYIKSLLAPKPPFPPKPKPAQVERTAPAKFETEYKPDPVKKPQVGYPQPGDKGDIWAQWVKQGRTGIDELIERWG